MFYFITQNNLCYNYIYCVKIIENNFMLQVFSLIFRHPHFASIFAKQSSTLSPNKPDLTFYLMHC